MANFIEKLKVTFSEEDIKIKESKQKRHIVKVTGKSLIDVAKFCKENLGFDHVISVSITDKLDAKQFAIYYHLSSISQPLLQGEILTLEVNLPRDSPHTRSLIDVWPSVEWHEREGWEMFGIEFEGHPKLERLLLPEDWRSGHPLRKDFKITVSDK
ncbi:MAG: NADH-quinone oxidoreductase subunit C [Promethearchaeota archaeon]